ncbi:MAG: aminopeptidase N [Dehalococcoidia bacterium]|nr:aminopeptidase N [Dehalococcoidia bacterium]
MTSTPARPRDVLRQSEAEERAARVRNARYDLSLHLERGAERYRGEITASFDLDGGGPVFLDYTGKEIHELEVNGQRVDAPDWTGHRLTLAAELLQPSNVVRVAYENEYDHDGDGFHQFVDPEDGEEYLYTNFEPYSAHRLFPCFDQPDIKASYRLAVTAPADWTLIANSLEERSGPAGEGLVRREFAETAPFSTYLFALIAGAYEAFREQHGDIPLGFYCRKSLARYVDTDELFEVTRQGLDFYSEFFNYPYPFQKYDQAFVPEFNAGAMENVAAVTHYERMVFRDPPTETQRLGRAEVILHEMAHMWFGDLVTMRWWNDLWLNESFATYMAYLALDRATRFDSSWQAFNSGMKNWAYRQDQLVTTHPIAGEVEDTDQTFQNFDGITYGKGASVLKQLVHAIGIDAFREGMRRYFERYAFGNTTLADFMQTLDEGTGRDLQRWSQLWLETPSLNTLAAEWEQDGPRVSGFTLRQTAPEDYPTLRPHRTQIAVVHEEAGGGLRIESIGADIDGAEAEVPEAVGRPAPAFVFPNHDDHAFVKVALDDASLEFVRERLQDIDDPLLRQLTWQSLWNMVRDQQLRSTDYLELAGPKAATERDLELVETILATMSSSIARYVPEHQKEAAAHRFFELAWRALNEVEGADLKIIWARTLIGVALTPDDIRHCGRLADGELGVEGLTVDQDMRWEIAARFSGYALGGARERIAAEAERDPSDRGQRAQRRIEASWPDPDVKAAAWERFTGEGYGSLHMTASAMNGFHWWVQRELTRPYAGRFFEEVTAIFDSRPNEFCSTYFGALFPDHLVEESTLTRSRALLDSLGDRLPLLRRSLREANDDLERALKCRAFAAS